MSEIVHLHSSGDWFGGAEAVAVHALQAIVRKSKYRVRLISTSRPNFLQLEKYYGVNINSDDIRVEVVNLPALLNTERSLWALRHHWFCRKAADFLSDNDKFISTYYEVPFGKRGLVYLHSPGHARLLCDRGATQAKRILKQYLYSELCQMVSGYGASKWYESTLLANSEWTARHVREQVGQEVGVVYPPVRGVDAEGRPWDDRVPRFTLIGRVAKDKNVLNVVEVVRHLREKGHEVGLDILGPAGDSKYGERVRSAVEAENDWVKWHGAVSRKQLDNFLAVNRYGIHGKKVEHFGITVAEMAHSGMLVFVPDYGGQTEIVQDSRLRYRTFSEAVDKISRVLRGGMKQEDLRRNLHAHSRKFSADRFQQQISEYMEAI